MIFPEPEPPQPAMAPAMQPRKIKTNLKRSLTVRPGEHSVAVIPAFSFLESDVVYDFTLCQNSCKRGLEVGSSRCFFVHICCRLYQK